MGNDGFEIMEGLSSIRTMKIHDQTCSELLKLVTAVSNILPEIEAARPRCKSGIEALCLLNSGIVKAKSLLEHCSESSVLYLALTGDAILSRCKKSRNILEQSLRQILDMVPVVLAAKIVGIISDLRSATFCLTPSEEKAGKVLRELLHGHGSDSTMEAALSAIHTLSSLLHITSRKALLVEIRSIRKLIDKFGDSEPTKRKILFFFLNLLNKYGKQMTKAQKSHDLFGHEKPWLYASPYDLNDQVELHVNYDSDDAQVKIFDGQVLPEEFICPLTSRLMYDPVVIASGETYERMWIQKWFDEGNETCPKTKMMLTHLSFTPNSVIKDMLGKWCAAHNVSIPDPKIHEESMKLWETSMTSIASLSSSMNDLNLPLEFINLPYISGMGSDQLHAKTSNGFKSSNGIDEEFFVKFDSLPWDSRCNGIEVFRRLVEQNVASWSIIPFDELGELLNGFLKDAHDLNDVKAQMSGCLLFLNLLQKDRSSISSIKEETYEVLASFLDTEVAMKALPILEVLSLHQHCAHKIIASGALLGILKVLDCQIQETWEPALRILSNLSSFTNLGSIIRYSEFIPKLVPLFQDNDLARCCVIILKNSCNSKDAKDTLLSIAQTDGCISAIADLLDCENRDVQECAVSILLSLCLHGTLYCQLVMNEGIIPGLVKTSNNGSDEAMAMARELLRILKDEYDKTGESSSSDVITDPTKRHKDDSLLPARSTGWFGKIFPKQNGALSKKKRLSSHT